MFECAGCKAKDDEIKHLRALVDSCLVGKGLSPVSQPVAPEKDPMEMPDVPDAKDDKLDVVRSYGGHE